jgi:phosphatidyl-myo-inositol alpha-mannosyltransferase
LYDRTVTDPNDPDREVVLFVDHGEYVGGSSSSLQVVLSRLANDLHCSVAAPPGPNRDALMSTAHALELVPLPTIARAGHIRPLTALRASIDLARWCRRRRRNLVAIHANGLVDFVLASVAAAVSRRHVVVWAHDADLTDRRSARLVPMLRWVVPSVRWAAVSSAASDMLLEAGCADARDVTVVANPIDPATVLAERAPLPGLTRVGFLGNDTTRKGFELLPEIADGLDPETTRLVVFARRHRDLPPEIAAAWDRLDRMTDRVEIAGRQEDVRSIYAQCDVVLCPSRHESFCRVAAEAMMNGIPVVASDIPAIREVLADGTAGLLFPSGDALAATLALRRLIDDASFRDQMAAAGRARALDFSPDQVVAQLARLYRDGESARS